MAKTLNQNSTKKQYIVKKYLNPKKGKGANQSVNWKKEFEEVDVFIMLTQKFDTHLMQNDIEFKNIDILIFDEINQFYAEHPINHIMIKYYFN